MNLKIFKTKKVFKKGGIHIDPDIYWGVSLVVASVCILASVVFGFFLFRKINKEFVAKADANAQVQAINKEKIDKALEYFAAREQKSREIVSSPSSVADPSR